MSGAPTRLADATWPEVEARVAAPRTLLVPLGATEQHGPHLPLDTDSAIAVALAEAAAARTAGAFVAPPVPYGSSGEHAGFPGTLSIGAAATELVLLELGRSASATFDLLVFVSAHGGNAAPLAAAVERLRHEGRDARAFAPRFGGDAHAGRTETSLMLALVPERVGARREPGNDAPLADLLDDLRDEGVRALSPNGVLGDPTGASAAEGRALLEAAVEDLCAAVRAAEPIGAAR
ncbi:MAG: mycofactocin biosynthesis peptidyl-dipeptidase MftE [Actinobacteria bacterium]|nr:mycofactocin biosynthesis peptidyl-dipeptidase MftE [Actinomycetota bacterium]